MSVISIANSNNSDHFLLIFLWLLDGSYQAWFHRNGFSPPVADTCSFRVHSSWSLTVTADSDCWQWLLTLTADSDSMQSLFVTTHKSASHQTKFYSVPSSEFHMKPLPYIAGSCTDWGINFLAHQNREAIMTFTGSPSESCIVFAAIWLGFVGACNTLTGSSKIQQIRND